MTKFDKKLYRICMLLLAFVIVFSGFSCFSLNSVNAESRNIIEIESEEDFLNIQNSPYISNPNTTFLLTKDLEFYYNSSEFNGFGKNDEPFSAKFNGQGFKLSGLNIQSTLFNYTEGADIRNIVIEDFELNGSVVNYASNTVFTNIGIYNYGLNIYNRDFFVINTPNNTESYFAYEAENCSFKDIAIIYNLSGLIALSNENAVANCNMVISSQLDIVETTGLTILKNNQISKFSEDIYQLLFSENRIGSGVVSETNNSSEDNIAQNNTGKTDEDETDNTDEENNNTEPDDTEVIEDNTNESTNGTNSTNGNAQSSEGNSFPQINPPSNPDITEVIFLIIFAVFGGTIIITPIIINIVKAIKANRK